MNNDVYLTYEEFEIAVRNHIKAKGENLEGFEISPKREVLEGSDGEYEFDVVAKFTVFGEASILVLIECKKYSATNPIKREKVQILYDKLRSVGGNKAMFFSTSKFQRGAIEYAQAHGISLVMFANNEITYAVKARFIDSCEVTIDEDGETAYQIVCDGNALLEEF
jgi:restriction system protein